MKKSLSFLLVFSLLFSSLVFCAYAEDTDDEIGTSAEAALLYCVNNGEVLFSENADEELAMASTTKIMTSLLTLEAARKENSEVTFSAEMIAEGSSMYLGVGEVVTLYDLAVGMMMQSGNDAANAAALTLGGSFENFAEMMNERAQEIGMSHTHFVTPSGLDDEKHYSSAYDMALLMACAMKNDLFRDIVKNTSMTVDFISPSDKSVAYSNHNKLLKLYEYCTGGKTGYTDKAGRCLVTSAEKDGLELVAVTLNDGDDWNDHIRMFEYGFENYTLFEPNTSDVCVTVGVVGSVDDTVDLTPQGDVSFVIPADLSSEIEKEIIVPNFIYAPVREGETLGKISFVQGDETLYQSPLTAKNDIAYKKRQEK